MPKPCLLIIDDDANFRKLVSHTLAKLDYSVIEAADGDAGLKRFAADKPDGVIIDLRMPGIDGMDVLQELAGQDSETPLFVLSGEGNMDDAIQALRNGAWDYVNKDEGFSRALEDALAKGFERAAFLRSQRERLESEIEERRLAENRFRTLLNVSPLPTVMVDLDRGICLFANERAADQFKVSRDEVEGLVTKPFFPENAVREGVAERLVQDGQIDGEELELCRSDGSRFWTLASARLMTMDGHRTAFISFSDITTRKSLAEALQKFKFIANASHDLMTLTNSDFVYEAANRTYLEYHGMKEEDLLGYTMAEIWGEENFEENIREHAEACLAGEIISYTNWFSFPGKDRRYYEVFMYPYLGKHGEVTHIATVSKDITEAAEAREQILASREHFRAIFESSLDPILLFDRDLCVVDMNAAANIKFGFSKNELEGRDLKSLHGTEEEFGLFEKTVVASLRLGGTWMGEWGLVNREGLPIATEMAISMMPPDAQGAPGGYVAVVRDISRRLNAEAGRRLSERRYRAVFESSGAATVLVDEAGTITKANRRFAEFVALNKKEIEGVRHWADFVHREDREELEGIWKSLLGGEGEAVISHEFRFITDDGRLRFVHIQSGLLPGTQETIGSITDVTERNYNETVARMLFRISNAVSTASDLDDLYKDINETLGDNLNAANFFVALLDETGRYLQFTHFQDEMDDLKGVSFDIEASDMASMSVEVIRLGRPLLVTMKEIPETEGERMAQRNVTWLTRQEFMERCGASEEDMIGSTSQGWLGVPLDIRGKVVGVMAVQSYTNPFQYTVKDVDLLVAVSEQVALAIERKRMDRELVRAMERAKAASESKSEFLANMSHEVRTPLNGVLGMLQLAQITDLTDEQRDYVDTALVSGRSLLSIINDILDFSKIEAGRLEIVSEPFSLRQLAEEVLASFRGVGESKVVLSCEFEGNIPSVVVGAKGRLRQILFNLVGNSVKFTEKGSVVVSMGVLERDALSGIIKVLMSVKDTGIGIPQGMVDHIFEPFTQVDGSHVRRHQGTGLGLGIVKRLVDLLGGTLDIDTEEGVGTVVHVTLEFELDSTAEVHGEEVVESDLGHRSLRILVVEDNRINRLLAARMLEKFGQVAETAEHGFEALEKLEATRFDAVFMDIQMPGMDGVELTRLIREGRPGSSIDAEIPIVAMTAHAMIGDREAFLAKGMDDYIAKPVEMDDIKEVLQRLWGRKN